MHYTRHPIKVNYILEIIQKDIHYISETGSNTIRVSNLINLISSLMETSMEFGIMQVSDSVHSSMLVQIAE